MPSTSDPVRPADNRAVQSTFPTVPAAHTHARALLENAMRYLAPESGTTDPISAYPVEGWNNQPQNGLGLHSFTQLTAIGEWIDVLANVVAGYADAPGLSKEQALLRLRQAVDTLCRDQNDPAISTKGLLGNFLDLASGSRLAPLVNDVDKPTLLRAFGPAKGEAIWRALEAKGWIVPGRGGRQAAIRRSPAYGFTFFNGPLAPFADEATKDKIMAILDRRVVAVMFGDNANLSISVARAIGALLRPGIKDDPRIAALRRDLDRFLDKQQEGYTHLYDAKAGMFSFGWDATREQFLGWEDGDGNWRQGHMDYMVNEFRGPTKFVVIRYGLPVDAIKNLGFKIKPYPRAAESDAYVLAPWEGSAFQVFGLGLCMNELCDPSWQNMLKTMVAVEIDYSLRHQLPGFLSESYTGEGARYTGDVGIPDIAVTTMPRITCSASLYSLGVAYTIAPDDVEGFLAANWPTISKLLTDHGPWEGFNLAKQEVIDVQTSAHTLSLILGLLGTGPENMSRYLEAKGLRTRLAEIYGPGSRVDFLSRETRIFAWGEPGASVVSTRDERAFHIKSDRVDRLGIAFVPPQASGVNLSNGVLAIGYRSGTSLTRATICFKPTSGSGTSPGIPNEVFTRFPFTGTQQAEIRVPLPGAPGLWEIKEIVITAEPKGAVDLSITRLAFTPNDAPKAGPKSPGKALPALP